MLLATFCEENIHPSQVSVKGDRVEHWPPPWWVPATASFVNDDWVSVKIRSLPAEVRQAALRSIFSRPSFGVSPEDIAGDAHVLVIDVEERDPKLLKTVLRLLSRGRRCPVWPTESGGKGHHLWLFFSRPVKRTALAPFLAAFYEVLQKEVGDDLPIETFPGVNGREPKPIRWFGTVHPQTGCPERLLDPRHPRKRDPYDTRLFLTAVADGFGRFPTEALRPELLQRRLRARASPLPGHAKTHALPPLVATNKGLPPTAAPGDSILELALKSDRFASYVARLLGVSFEGVGQPTRCPLHPPDKRPSAVWVRTQDGKMALFCHHLGATVGLPDLLHFAETRALRCPRRLERKDLLLRHLARSNLLPEFTEKLIQVNFQTLREALSSDPQTSQVRGSDDAPPSASTDAAWRVWTALVALFRANTEAGKATVLAPTRRLAGETGLSQREIVRALNWLCAIGVVRKFSRGPGQAQGLFLTLAAPEEAQKRAQALGPWRACSRRRVEAVLGAEAASRIFLRPNPAGPG